MRITESCAKCLYDKQKHLTEDEDKSIKLFVACVYI